MLTETNIETLEALDAFIRARGYSPSLRDLSEMLGVTHGAVNLRVIELRDKGLVKYEPRKGRTMRIDRRALREVTTDLGNTYARLLDLEERA